jgi:cytochrome P450
MSDRGPSDISPREGCPVHDWATDFDVMDEGYVKDPGPVWDELREQCPIAHTTRWGGAWLPTKYDDIRDMARAAPTLSNRSPGVIPPAAEMRELLIAEIKEFGSELPPISSDAPEHKPFKQMILPLFSPKAVEAYRPFTEKLANDLIDNFIETGEVDAAIQYAEQIPPRVIAYVIGIDESRADEFTEWVRGVIEQGQTNPEARMKYRRLIRDFFQEMIEERRDAPRDDAISKLMASEVDGKPGVQLPPPCCTWARKILTGSSSMLTRSFFRRPLRNCCASIPRSPWPAVCSSRSRLVALIWFLAKKSS